MTGRLHNSRSYLDFVGNQMALTSLKVLDEQLARNVGWEVVILQQLEIAYGSNHLNACSQFVSFEQSQTLRLRRWSKI